MNPFPLDRAFLWLLMACAGTLIALPVCIRLGGLIGVLDHPGRDGRRVHRQVTPRVGGLAIAAAFLPIAAAIGTETFRDPWLLASCIVLLAVGVADDRGSLRPTFKLAAHGLAVAAAVIGADLVPERIPLLVGGLSLEHSWACTAVTVFIGMGLINAINLIDGLDGLATGLCGISAAAIAAIAASTGDVGLCLTAMALVGSLVAVLSQNTHPARIFLGDAGSMLLGLLMTCLSLRLITGSQQDASIAPVSVFLPLLILAIPWADSLWVMIVRMARRRDPFSGDRTHVHHQVLGLGIRHRYAVLLLLAADVALAAVAVALAKASDATIVMVTLGSVIAILGGVRWLTRDVPTHRMYRAPARWTRWYARKREREPTPVPGGAVDRVAGAAQATLFASFIGLQLLAVLAGGRPSGFLGLGAIGMLALLLFVVITGRSANDHFRFFVAFAAATYLSLAVALWLPWQQGNDVQYIARALLLVGFVASVFILTLERRLQSLVSTPLELFGLAAALATIALASSHYFFNALYAASSSICLFAMLKALSTHPRRSSVAVVAIVVACAGFAGLQWLNDALFSPFQ